MTCRGGWWSLVLFLGVLAVARPSSAHEWLDYFQPNDAQLSTRGYQTAQSVAAYYHRNADRKVVRITGHEDADEAKDSSPRPSLRRARAMMLELLRLGVPPQDIELEDMGDRQMARLSNGSEPLNRRVLVGVSNLTSKDGRPYPPSSRFSHSDQPLIFFESGSSELNPRMADAVTFALQVSMFGHTSGDWRVVITGYADTAGDAAANLELSRRRAETVARILARNGMPWADVQIVAVGETLLARATTDGVAEPLNRRVEVRYNKKPVAS